MPRDPRARLEDMLEFANKAHRKATEAGRETFDRDEDVRVVVAHWVLILGEAAASVPPDMKASYPSLPWKEMIGMRNRLVHEYFSIDYEIVWITATQSLLPLIEQLERLIASEEQ